MKIQCVDECRVLCMQVGSAETIIRFSDEAQPNIKSDIANILTAAYEERIQSGLDKYSGEGFALSRFASAASHL